MTKIEITKYHQIYNQEVVNLISNIQKNEFNIAIDIEAQPDLKNISEFYQIGNGNFWIAKINNIVVGTIGLLDIGRNNVALRKMFVKSEFRGKEVGVGQTLLNKVFEWTIEKKVSNIFLGTTNKFLAAQRFYDKNGFTEIDKNLLPEEFPVMSVDVKFYKYFLNK